MADERISCARLWAAHHFPYFSSGLFSLIPIETDDLSRTGGMVTMGVDKRWRMIYHVGIFDQWGVDKIGAVMVHEVMHLLRDHPDRSVIATTPEFRIWNLAADCEINDDLKSIGLPDGCVYPSTFGFKEDLIAEEYFNLLMQLIKQAGGLAGDGEGEGEGENGKGNGNGKGGFRLPKPGVGAGMCGGCATGEGDDETVPGEDGKPVSGITQRETQIIKNAVAKDIVAHKGRGSMPGGLLRWAEEQLTSHVPWRKVLNGCIRGLIGDTIGMVNYKYTRPSRRQSAFPKIVMPSLRAPLPNIAIQIDTSGSMSQKDLAMAVAEVDGVLKGLGVTEVTVISNDAEANAVGKVRRAKDVQLVGGGGTDMGPGIVKADTLRPKIDFLVIVSDCDAVWGDFVPRFPVIVVKVGNSSSEPPAWIKRTIQVTEDDY